MLCYTRSLTLAHGLRRKCDTWWYRISSFFITVQGVTPLARGDSGTFAVLTRYEFMQLQSLRQSERTTARDSVQHTRWTYPCYRVVSTEHQQRWRTEGVGRLPNIWQMVINKGGGEQLYWRYINVLSLWIKLCQKYRTVAITFYPTLICELLVSTLFSSRFILVSNPYKSIIANRINLSTVLPQ